jgi:hypothetical protein
MLAASLTPESRDTMPSGIVEGGERKRIAVEVSKAAELYTAQRAVGSVENTWAGIVASSVSNAPPKLTPA